MTAADGDWDAEIRPHRVKLFVYTAAILIAGVHIAVSLLLTIGSTGVLFRTYDQFAVATIGLIIAGFVLLFGRPRLRVGAAGLSVRNVFGDKLVPWSAVTGVTFPAHARWARVDLPDDEYIPLMAIQAIDGDRAVAAMDTVRELLARYRPDAAAG